MFTLEWDGRSLKANLTRSVLSVVKSMTFSIWRWKNAETSFSSNHAEVASVQIESHTDGPFAK